MTLTLGHGPLAGRPAALNFSFDAAPAHRILFQPYAPRLRALVGDRVVLDTTRAHLLHETGILPVVYAPLEDFDPDVLARADHSTHCPFKGDASYFTVRAGDRELENAVWAYEEPHEDAAWLRGFASLYFDRADAWFVEDERVFGPHLRDPYHRVDVHETERPARVTVAGTVIAETTRAKLVFETGLPARVYVPGGDVRAGALSPSDTRSECPYKGEARYWHLELDGTRIEDAAWSYETPLPEALKAQGHLCFDAADGVEVELGDPPRRLTL